MRYLWLMMLASVFAASPALAQDQMDEGPPQEMAGDMQDVDFLPESGDWEFLLSGTGANNKDFDAGSFNVTADIGKYVTDDILLALRQSVGYTSRGAGERWTGNTRFAADYHFTIGDDIRPFVGANIGYIYGEGVRDTWAAGPEGGVKWYVKDETFLIGRMGYQFFFRSADDVEKDFDDGQFTYTVGVGFNF